MAKFYQDLMEMVGRCYQDGNEIRRITSVDVSVGEVHYDIIPEGERSVRKGCSSISSFALFDRVPDMREKG